MTVWKKNNCWLLFILFSVKLYGQQFQHASKIDSVSTSGFYSIPITAEISRYCKPDLVDLRISDNKGEWVPHLIRNNLKQSTQTQELKIHRLATMGSSTIVIVENSGKRLLSELILFIKNAASERKASLSGSDDSTKWFIITDSLLVNTPDEYKIDESSQRIAFPAVNYRFIRITIRNDGKDPLNIQTVRSIVPSTNNSTPFIENPAPQFHQLDSGKWTYVRIRNYGSYPFDQINFVIARPAFFERTARIYELRDGQLPVWNAPALAEFNIRSGQKNNYQVRRTKQSEYYLIISNLDNPPLEISAVQLLQEEKILLAYLEKGGAYELLMNNPEAGPPQYDLNRFDRDIPSTLPLLSAGAILPSTKGVRIKEGQFWSNVWIWPVVILVILLLGYLTFSLTNDLRKRT